LQNRILIVDDEVEICSVLAKRLTKEGYTCVTANNGREALTQFYKDNFSLIISDIKMPEMDGMELLNRVKGLNPDVTVVIMTAYPEIDKAVEAAHLGAYDFVIKPIDLDLVVLAIKNALEKKSLEEEIELYHNNLERLVSERTAKLQEAQRILKKAYLDSVKVLVGVIEAKDPFTRGHSDRVKQLSLRIASSLGFTDDRLESLEYGALLHDIGKIGIKDEVLQKVEALTFEEYRHIQEHPLIGVKILEGIDFFKDKIPMIRNHHEHFDGCGYPDGLAGESIPLEERIISVADAYGAMTSGRPHRKAMPLQDVLMELWRGKGKQFDPHIVDIFLNEKIYKLIMQLSADYGDGNH
jgi:putative nucleotidyltransferase with HDIG domain